MMSFLSRNDIFDADFCQIQDATAASVSLAKKLQRSGTVNATFLNLVIVKPVFTLKRSKRNDVFKNDINHAGFLLETVSIMSIS